MNNFMTERYKDIMLMSKKICKGSHEWEDVGHFAITEFMTHERGQELVDSGRAMNFLSGIIWRSFHSSTSSYHTLYRQKGRVHELKWGAEDIEDTEYDHDADIALTAIQGILEDMGADKSDLWYRASLFKMWIETPNYSQIHRQTGIPRTSISQAIEECKTYIKAQLKIQGIDYEF